MNDFTKKELGIIYCNLAVNDKTKDVLSKITAMFENYCEHPNIKYCSDCVTETCTKCKKRW